MNKKFTKLIAALALLSLLTIPTGMWGQTRAEVVAYTLTPTSGTNNSYAGNCDITIDEITWNLTGNSTTQPWRIGGKSLTGVDRPLYSKTAIAHNITKIVVTHGTASGITVNSWTVIVSKNSDFSSPVSTLTPTFTASTTTTINRPDGADWSNCYYKFIYNVTVSGTSNKFLQFTEAEFYAETGGGQQQTVATPTFDPAGGSYTSTQNVTISCETEGSTIYYTTDGSTPDNTSTQYTTAIPVSSTTTINAIAYVGNDASSVATATYTIVNLEHAGTEADPYSVADARTAIDANVGVTGVYATGIVSNIAEAYSTQHSNISGDTDFLRAYRCTGTDAADVQVGDIVVVSGNLIYYSAQSLYEFSSGCVLQSLTHPAAAVEHPTFSPAAGTYADAQNVTLACETSGATIYYTTDGTDPTSTSSEYTGAIAVSTTTTIKAIAINGSDESTVATATYHINSATSPYTVAQALAFHEYPTSTIWVHGIVSTAPTQAPTSNGELTYYISDDGTTTSQLEVYKGKGLEQAAFTAQDDIQVGDSVTVYGSVKIYGNIKEFDQGNYLTSFVRPVVPSINAEDVNIAYNATSGSIDYTIENGTGSVGASVTTGNDWITLGTITDSTVPFTCLTNTTTAERTATVTLTFTGAADKVVTITQAGMPVPTINAANVNIAYNATSGSIDYTIENGTGSVSASVTTGSDWITLGTITDSTVPFTCSDNDGNADRTATITLSYTGATDKVITVTQGHFVVDYAELPFEWDDTSTPTGITNSGVGTYGSSPYLKFDTQGDYIILKINETPGTLTYDIKGNTLSGSYKFTVLESANGTDYTTLKEYTSIGSSVANESLNPASTTRYIKWEYTTKSSGNVALGNIALAEYVDPATVPTITLANTTVNVDAAGEDDGSIAITYQNLGITANDDFDIQFYDANNQELDKQDEPTWLAVSVQDADPSGYEVSYSVDANDSDARTAYFKVYALDNNLDAVYSELVTVSQAAAPVPTIELAPATLNVAAAGVNHCSNTITLTNMTVSEAKDFSLKFCSQTGGDLTEDPEWLADEPEFHGPDDEGKYSVIYNIAANTGTTSRTAYFKVYATPAAGKDGEIYSNIVTVTQAAPVAGEDTWVLTALADLTSSDVFVIVGNNGSNYAMSNNNGTSAPAAVEVIVSGNNLTGTIADNIQWNISGNAEDGYTFYPNGETETWLYCINNNNGLRVGATEENKLFVINNSYLYNSGQSRYIGVYNSQDWRSYTSINNNIKNQTFSFYKKVTASALTKEIKGYGGGESDSYYLIASPVASITPSAENGFLTTSDSDYDLYSFDQAQELEWCNFKNQTTGGWNLVSEKGYLYASKYGTTLVFTGDAYAGTGEINLTAGWNLIGNPYATTATLDKPFYRMNEAGDDFAGVNEDEDVYAMEGVFVHATTNATATFTAQSKGGKQSIAKVEINVSGSRGTVIDNAIVRFDKGETLEKFMLNPSHTRLYFTEGSKDYAIVRSNGQDAMPVNFKASQDGTYTLSVNAENLEMGYLHLIDNMTGADVDLLATPSYTFEAKTTDYASRFRLVFSANDENGASTGSETFAFFNGSEWMISNTGDATLQIVDMLGRVVSSENLNGNATISTNGLSNGVYVMRLVNGENVKTQKIVVR